MKHDVFPIARRRFRFPRIVFRNRSNWRNRRNLSFLRKLNRRWFYHRQLRLKLWLRSTDRCRGRHGLSITSQTSGTPSQHSHKQYGPLPQSHRLRRHPASGAVVLCFHTQSVGLSIYPVFAVVPSGRKFTSGPKLCQCAVRFGDANTGASGDYAAKTGGWRGL